MEPKMIAFEFNPARVHFPESFLKTTAYLDLLEAGFVVSGTIHPALNDQLISNGFMTGNAAGLLRLSEEKTDQFILYNAENTAIASGKTVFDVVQSYFQPKRNASHSRKTAETDIQITVDLDGTGKSSISTGLAFFDHMLEQIARHGLVDLTISCKGDLHIDEHHTIEDTALALGECLLSAIGDKKGIERYSWALPMDETLALVSLDLSGRPYLQFESELRREKVGDFPTEMARHFFYSLAMTLKSTLQMRVTGDNDHHQIEALFKGFARCLRGAVARNPRIRSLVPSSKGIL